LVEDLDWFHQKLDENVKSLVQNLMLTVTYADSLSLRTIRNCKSEIADLEQNEKSPELRLSSHSLCLLTTDTVIPVSQSSWPYDKIFEPPPAFVKIVLASAVLC
jgi:hypothetical protein